MTAASSVSQRARQGAWRAGVRLASLARGAAAGLGVRARGADPRGDRCYQCRRPLLRAHEHYPRVCLVCGDLNLARRAASADLSGRRALVTGGRRGVGYATALRLLRAGAEVTVTTRFPVDAAMRYAREPDFERYRGRLALHGADFRDLSMVHELADSVLERYPRLDVLVLNAAQTVRRPAAYYREIVERERRPELLPPVARELIRHTGTGEPRGGGIPLLGESRAVTPRDGAARSALLAQAAILPEDREVESGHFPAGVLDEAGDPVDLRDDNSWSQRLETVAPLELLEVQLINVTAPFLLCQRLTPRMRGPRERGAWVIAVSAREGQFALPKTPDHPHTNMAKAALNMLVRTSAAELMSQGIQMVAVDTGWVSHQRSRRALDRDHAPVPLDFHDGAARVLDPMFTALASGHRPFGVLLKDFRVAPW